MKMKRDFFLLFLMIIIMFSASFVSASYTADVYFNVPESVYMTNERIELKGYVYQANFSATDNSSLALTNVNVNLTIKNFAGAVISNYTFITDINGTFYSGSNFYTNATNITAPSDAGEYNIRAEYKNPENTTIFSEVAIEVVNKTMDSFIVSANKATYNPSETMIVEIEAVKLIGDRVLYVSGVSINGSLRNSTKGILQNFNCTTGVNGKCSLNYTSPSAYGDYILELEDFKTFNSFSVIPFKYNLYMKDELGKSLKNVFAIGEQGKVEVRISNASSSDIYIFSGYIQNSAGENIKTITSTTLNNNNSFTNSFLFTLDSITFSYGAYSAYVTIIKSGDGNISSITSFQVKDWSFYVDKNEVNSGFEYEYSAFLNQTLKFITLPTYRSNGTTISNLNSSSFSISLKDKLNNIISTANSSWNASCGKSGCYEFSLSSPLSLGEYTLYTTLSFLGDIQTETKIINVVEGVLSAQSSDSDGNTKELFGTNEPAYLSLTAYNQTSSGFNVSDAEIFLVSYMNGTDFSYTNVSNFGLVNMSNSDYEWAWNSTSQRIKLDVPKVGGVYNVFIFANNRTLGTYAKFIVNPYDICSVPKDTPGTVGSGYYYVWQFKTSDTVYFELQLTQANNPLGRASALNSSGGNGTGTGSQCNANTNTKQVVNNATLTVIEVKNLESGVLQSINSSASTCQSSDSSGRYTCTIKPSSKWEGGQNIVQFKIQAQDGTESIAFGRFEARAFYLYGWSAVWQNNPSSDITLNLQMYEAGNGWWGRSTGLSGTVVVKKVEYQGSDGEWLWPPIDSGYNASSLNSTSISGYSNSIVLPASSASGGAWKTGYYRVLLQATTSSGDTDYGYAWFGVKLWDVYGSPIECINASCNYKSYFNSKENITLYVTINRAGNYNSYSGGQDIYGNVTIGIKKIQDCRTWPCKELNSSDYVANTLNVNESSPWYYSASLANQSKYIIQINKTQGSWNTGYYSVILEVNGTDTGYAWFNAIAFYVETQPTNSNASAYKYNIRGNQPMYFNVTTTKNYKWNYYGDSRYNESDYVNVTFYDAILRTWDQITYQSKELNYPEDINITPLSINGSALINLTYLNGSWPSGYYWGELILKNADDETSTGWLWFNVQPFRVEISTSGNTYNLDIDSCVNATLNVKDSDWNLNNLLDGNYSIIGITENVWTGYSNSITNYTNYTSSSFNATANITICPNSASWESGSWGGYHYLNILVKDNVNNDTQVGWLSFRTVPFIVSWGYVGSARTGNNVNTTVSLTKPAGGVALGNITRIYQWRYDSSYSGLQEYIFSVGNSSTGICYSNVSGQCKVNGTQAITVYRPLGGWRTGWNYLYADWTKDNNADIQVQDGSGVYFEGKEAYSGWYDNWWYDNSGGYNYKYYAALNENILIKLNVRDMNQNNVNVSVTSVEYAFSGNSCGSDYCRTYISGSYSYTNLTSGGILLNLSVPSTNWTGGDYAIRASVSGSEGTATITGGIIRAKDFTGPNMTILSPINNASYNGALSFNATSNENAQCYVYIVNYDNFYNWYCSGWNSTNSSNSTSNNSAALEGACNSSKYGYNGSTYYTEWVSRDYRSTYNGNDSIWGSGAYLTTGGRSHTYIFNVSGWANQSYGLNLWCYDEDNNYVSYSRAFRMNGTSSGGDTIYPQFSSYWDNNGTLNGSGIAIFNVTILNTNNTVWLEINNSNYTANNISASVWNYSLTLINNTYSYRWWAYGNGTNKNINNSGARSYTMNNTA